MNTLSRLKYAMGFLPKAPKIEFDEKYCLLTPKNPTATITLENKIKIAQNAAIFRFNFRNEDLILGTKIGQYVNLITNIKDENTKKEEKISRSFVPISGIDDMGIVDFLVRIYRPDEKTKFAGGAFTNFMDTLKVNDTLQMTGPFTTFLYNGLGSFEFPSEKGIREVSGIRYLGLLASGNGITAFFQMLETIARSRIDKTNISLLYINREYKDMLLLEELVSFHEQNKLHLSLMLEQPETFWPGLSGELNPEILRDTLPPPGPETLIMGCVSKEKKETTRKMLNELGYSDKMIFLC